MKQNKDSFNKASTLIALTVILSSVVYAWTGPSGTPPNNNVATPLNVGVEGQAKLGGLGIGGPFLASGISSFESNVTIGSSIVPASLKVFGESTFDGLTTLFNSSTTFEKGIKITQGAGAGKVLTSDASGNAGWQEQQISTLPASVYSQGYLKYEKTGNKSTIVTVSGDSNAFTMINNVSVHNQSQIKTANLDGIGCSSGWRLVSCWEVLVGADNDIYPYDNGCISNDINQDYDLNLSIVCLKVQ